MLIKVRVKTGAKNERIEKVHNDLYKIDVREKPEANRANTRVLAMLAQALGHNPRSLQMIKGHHSPSKTFSISEQ